MKRINERVEQGAYRVDETAVAEAIVRRLLASYVPPSADGRGEPPATASRRD